MVCFVIGKQLSLLKLIFHFFIKEKFKVSILILICMLSGCVPTINGLILKILADNLSADIGNLSEHIMGIALHWGVIYFIWWEALNLFNRLYDYIYLKTLPVIIGNVVDDITNYTNLHSQSFFNKNYVGDISQKISLSALAIEEFFAITIEKMLLKICLILSTSITLFYINPLLSFVFTLWVIFFLVICWVTGKKSHQSSNEYAKKYNKLNSVIVDILSNISTIRMFNGYKNEAKYIKKYTNNFVEKYQDLQFFMTKVRYVQSLTMSIMILFMIYLMSTMQNITVGDYVLVITLCITVADYIRDLIQEISDMYEKIGVVSQCQTLLVPHEIQDKENAVKLIIIEGKIEYKKVYFQYQKNKNLFYNKSICIKGKEKIGLVGFSGSGKTSFANLITRIYQVDEGQILIDGHNINDVTLESLRSSTSIIPQNPILLNRTIAENLKYGSQATDEEMIEAAKKASIHDFIQSLPHQYQTNCGYQGNLLSGGEKQRVAIARAILKDAPILILDEATSSLDSVTESQIQESLKFLMQGKTVLVIAHKISTLVNMDRILVFDNGRIVEDGIHKELLQNRGLYSRFWNSQIRV
jgi:ATP-binding cassette subfamily B protein